MAGLCDDCAHRRGIRSDRGSVFTMCLRGLADPAYAKYPPLPVLACAGFERKAAESEAPHEDAALPPGFGPSGRG